MTQQLGEYGARPWVNMGARWDGDTLVRVEETVWPKPVAHVDDDVFFVVVADPDGEKSDPP